MLFIHTFFLTSPVFREDDALKRVVNFFSLFSFFFFKIFQVRLGKHSKT